MRLATSSAYGNGMVAVVRKYVVSIFVSFAIIVPFIMFTNHHLLLCIASDDSDYDAVVAFTLPNR